MLLHVHTCKARPFWIGVLQHINKNFHKDIVAITFELVMNLKRLSDLCESNVAVNEPDLTLNQKENSQEKQLDFKPQGTVTTFLTLKSTYFDRSFEGFQEKINPYPGPLLTTSEK